MGLPPDTAVSLGHHFATAGGWVSGMFVGSGGEELWALVMVQREAGGVVVDLPGGKRHLGEVALECALREAKEEVGIDFSGASVVAERYDGVGMTVFVLTDGECVRRGK